jgi:excisionase family DNA binding protein
MRVVAVRSLKGQITTYSTAEGQITTHAPLDASERLERRLAIAADPWANVSSDFSLSSSEAASYITSVVAGMRFSARTLLTLAKNGKVQYKLGAYHSSARAGRKFWFSEASLERLMAAHRVFNPHGFFRISRTLASRMIAGSPYPPGKVITIADAAWVLNCSISFVHYLIKQGQLKAIRLGDYRLVVIKYERVRAFQLRRSRSHRRRGARLPGDPLRISHQSPAE